MMYLPEALIFLFLSFVSFKPHISHLLGVSFFLSFLILSLSVAVSDGVSAADCWQAIFVGCETVWAVC